MSVADLRQVDCFGESCDSPRNDEVEPLESSLRDSTHSVESWQSTQDSQAKFHANEADLSNICAEILARIATNHHAIFLLNGDIGAGKTTLVKAFAKQVGISDSVTSPTFSLLHIYGAESSLENSSLGASCIDFENLGRFADAPVQSHAPNFQKTPQSPPQNTRIVDSSTDSSLRGESMDSPKQSKQNQSRVSATLKALSGAGVGVVREGEGSDFAIRQNLRIQAPIPSLKKNARGQKGEFNADLSAQSRKKIDSRFALDSRDLDSSPMAQNDGISVDCFGQSPRNDESFLDSSPMAQNDDSVDCFGQSPCNDESLDCFGDESPRNDEKISKIYHYDLFNRNLGELLDLGLLDLLEENGIHFVEWGDSQLFDIIKNAFENIFIINIHKTKNARIYEFKENF